MNLAAIASEQARARPDAVAIRAASRGREAGITFAELNRAAVRAAALLSASGLMPGDRVLVFQPMSIELYIALLAIFRLGLVAVFLDPSAGLAHIGRCCELAPPAAFIGSRRAQWLRLVSPALRRIPRNFLAHRLTGPTGLTGQGATACDAGAPALLTFTSGSTGEPKAAIRTHGFLLAQHRVLERSIALVPGEIDLTTLPIFGLANLASGVTTLIPDADLRRPGAIDARPVVDQMLRQRATRTAASPAFFERIATFCESRRCQLGGIEKIYTGGAPVFPSLLGRLQAIAPRAEVVAVYGSTEAEPIAHVSHGEMTPGDLEISARGGGLLAGMPVPEIKTRVLEDQWGVAIGPLTVTDFDALTLPANSIGEIVVSGAHVLDGYLNGRGDAETKFRVDGCAWHRTGDAGYFDSGGRLWLVGRCSAKVSEGSDVLYPFAVECVAQQFAFVKRCAFIEVDGRRVLAVELTGSHGAADMQRLREALAWARLSEIRPLRRIPVDGRHNAKIDYGRLRKLMG
jgi:acyl-CoA synthetase (AMP-forming)/AMP-acid ligase II